MEAAKLHNINKQTINCIIENSDIINQWIINRARRIAKNRRLCLVERRDVEQAIIEYLDNLIKEEV